MLEGSLGRIKAIQTLRQSSFAAPPSYAHPRGCAPALPQAALRGAGKGAPTAPGAALPPPRWGRPRHSRPNTIIAQGCWGRGRAGKAPFIGEVLPTAGSPRCPLCTVPGLMALPGWLGTAWEPGGERAGRRSSPRAQFPSSGRPRSHWAFLEMAAGLLLGGGVCSAGGAAVPYQSWSRTSPWQMCRERELQTVEG